MNGPSKTASLLHARGFVRSSPRKRANVCFKNSWRSGAQKQCVSEILLDASAVLALVFAEHGAGAMADITTPPLISSVNFVEVLSRASDRGIAETNLQRTLRDMDLRVLEFRAQHARWAARLRPSIRPAGL